MSDTGSLDQGFLPQGVKIVAVVVVLGLAALLACRQSDQNDGPANLANSLLFGCYSSDEGPLLEVNEQGLKIQSQKLGPIPYRVERSGRSMVYYLELSEPLRISKESGQLNFLLGDEEGIWRSPLINAAGGHFLPEVSDVPFGGILFANLNIGTVEYRRTSADPCAASKDQ